MSNMVCIGDKTTHGGTVLSGSDLLTIDGKGVARVGDMVSCPLPGHGNNQIIEGGSGANDNGRPYALDGSKTACGSHLIASQTRSGQR